VTSEYDDLIDSFQAYDAYVPPSSHEWTPHPGTNGDPSGLPGHDYNQRGSWRPLLMCHGWKHLGRRGVLDYWSRPGKDPPGVSATTGLRSDCGRDLLYVFSSNAVPFESNRSYSKFAARTELEFGGNYSACAVKLLDEGYGTPATPTATLHFTGTIPPIYGQGQASGSQVRTIEPYVPFPTEALPHPLREFVEHGSAALGCDAAYFALPVLAVVASCIGNARVIVLKPGWDEPSVLWTCVIGESGTLKSPAWHKAVEPLYRWQKDNLRQYKSLLKQWKKDIEVWNQKNNKYLQALKTGGPLEPPGLEPVKPVEKRLVTSDPTIEKLALLLEQTSRGLLLARDELAAWLGGFERYHHKGSDVPHWLEAYRAGPWIIDRKTGDQPTLLIPRAAVSVCGGITPGALRKLLSAEYLEHGLGARLLMAWPPRRDKHWTEACIPEDITGAYEGLLASLLALDGDRDDQDDLVPARVKLSPEAKKVWVPFYDSWARETGTAEGELAAAYSKLEGVAARLALLHHTISEVMAGRDGRADIAPESIEAGVTLARWFGREARRVYAMFSETETDRNVRQLIDWIRLRGGAATTRDLQKSNSRKYPSSEAADAALGELVNGKWGEWRQTSTTSAGGRPSRTFFLHPTPDNTDTTPPEEPLLGEEASDTASDTTSANPQKPRVSEGSVGFVGCRTPENSEQTAPEPGGGSVGREGVLSDGEEVNEGEL
jgi:hypothetical protein